VVARAVAVGRALADLEQAQGRKFCYSPNLTGAGANVIEAFHRVDDAMVKEVGKGLEVVKLDVLPVGFGALEALRRHFQAIGREVVITVYPAMYSIFDPVIDRTVTLQLARLAGADVLYPGRPVILTDPKDPRRIDANQLNRVVKRFYPVLLGEMPGIKRTMPTVAGGVKPTDIRMYYEFAGPYVGFFIGGGIAAAPGGPGKGARYCVHAASCAARGRDFSDERDLTLAELESIGWYAPDVDQILRADPDLAVYLWRNWKGRDGLPG
jgi:ribulose 1,5-bisphosphate carboxylase large subunit-like protein